MNNQTAGSANRNHSVRVPSLFDIFRGKIANGYRRIAQWRREGLLTKGRARRTHYRRIVRLETIEPRLLLSADLIHTAEMGVAINATVKVADVDGAPEVQLVDNPSSTVLAAVPLDQDVNVTVAGNNMSDVLTIGFNRASVPHQIHVAFDGGDGGTDELIGPDRATKWQLTAPSAGTLDDGSFSGIERVKGGAADNTFVVLDAS